MSRGKGDHLLHLEPKRNARAVRNQLGDSLTHGEEFGHGQDSISRSGDWVTGAYCLHNVTLSFMRILRWGLLVFVVAGVIAWFVVPAVVESRMNRVLQPPPYSASQAQALHEKLIVADLHADSLLWKRNLLERGSRGQVDLPRLSEGNVAIQAFTVVTTSPRGLNIYKNSDDTDQITALAMA